MPLDVSAMSSAITVTKHSVSEFASLWTGNMKFGEQHSSTTHTLGSPDIHFPNCIKWEGNEKSRLTRSE